MLPRNYCSKAMNEGLWALKIIIVIGLFILLHFISNDFFEGYKDFSKYFSVLFLILQSIIFIDLFYMWG